ncbi:glycoside hydrolase family 18 protein [Primorskyibacter aestuariivivens]|uniref:glycoside hydrolase family 18 protein n=1 Tax=Primorskyibacter aestuariivivens TaxID=1888912 RepID=UPI002301C41E|nr:glycoside hydrolase family 18 protein [Primorskyibacter aestuariivivens]MDA7427728.1 glycoside hydrolase family 18 protein [Primorskyibacter aestuariivivens]
MSGSTLPTMCNAWIFLNEDDPMGPNGYATTTYPDPNGAYQRLIAKGVYEHVDMLFICFAALVPTSDMTTPKGDGEGFTIQMGEATHPSQDQYKTNGYPVRYSNQNYLNWVIRDARAANPNIKILMTLQYGRGTDISSVFLPEGRTDQENAEDFAANLLTYLRAYDLDGFDIDWESPLSDDTTTGQMATYLDAIGTLFAKQTDKKYWLTISPATAGNLDATAMNAHVDFLNLQLYSGFTFESDFTGIGIDKELLAYGAKFESTVQTAQSAFSGYQSGGYKIATMWRLNSGNFEYEQDNQIALYNLVHGA